MITTSTSWSRATFPVSRPWFTPPYTIEMTRAEFDKLSERGKKLLARCRVVE